jgi:hypothetical protein
MEMETLLTKARLAHELNNLDSHVVHTEEDPNHGNYVPNDSNGIENSLNLPDEIRKLYNIQTPELQHFGIDINSETSSRDYENMNEVAIKYFRAKWEFYIQTKLDKFTVSNQEIEEGLAYARDKDARTKNRADFMFSQFDYDNDRSRVRQRFLDEMNKKTTLQDIGESLDKMLIDEKAAGIQFWDPSETEKVKSASKDKTNVELSWAGNLF